MSSVFSGSYSPEQVSFLLQRLHLANTPILDKEHLIQSGQKHYSELLTHETAPAHEYAQLFRLALSQTQTQLAVYCCALAAKIVATRPQGITLVSLLRAGTPIAILLKAILQRYYAQEVAHYGISIIRDVGLDAVALSYIVARHAPETLVFVDGWTGKGVISATLQHSLQQFTQSTGISIPVELYVLADLAGTAEHSATTDDCLIPTCLLNATVSGLISRSVYQRQTEDATPQFHGCLYYADLAAHDLSGYFIDVMLQRIAELWPTAEFAAQVAACQPRPERQRALTQPFLNALLQRYGISHPHYLKPGIGEASRVLLRRKAGRLLLQQANSDSTAHLRWLAHSKAIPIDILPESPFQAIALISEITP